MKRLIIAVLVAAMVVFSIGITVADNDETHPDNPKQQGPGPNAGTLTAVLDYEEHPDNNNPKNQGLGPK